MAVFRSRILQCLLFELVCTLGKETHQLLIINIPAKFLVALFYRSVIPWSVVVAAFEHSKCLKYFISVMLCSYSKCNTFSTVLDLPVYLFPLFLFS